MSEFESVRPSGLIAMNLDDDDNLGWACLTGGEDEIMLVTRMVRHCGSPNPRFGRMGRQASGVIGIRMRGNDELASMEVVEPTASCW